MMEREFDLKGVVLVTVGGGRNDIQVPTSHTNTPLADLATTTANVRMGGEEGKEGVVVVVEGVVVVVVEG